MIIQNLSVSKKRFQRAPASSYLQRHTGHVLQGVQRQAFNHIKHDQAIWRNVNRGQISVDARDARHSGQRVATVVHDLAFAVLGLMLHHHEYFFGADCQIHRTTYGWYGIEIGRAHV